MDDAPIDSLFSISFSKSLRSNQLQPALIREEWLKMLRTSDEALLKRRLAWGGMDSNDCPRVLAAWSTALTITVDDQRFLASARDAIAAAAGTPLLSCLPASDRTTGTLPFVDLWAPAAEAATLNMALQLKQSADTLTGLNAALLARLCTLGQHALAAMFDAERGIGVALTAQVKADWSSGAPPPRDDYRRFIDKHRCDRLAALLGEFPVLGRLIEREIRRWSDCAKQMITRITDDRSLLQSAFGIPADAPLVSLCPALGDPHCGGQTTSRATFAGAKGLWQIAYKPRSLALETAFNEAIAHTHSSHLPPLKTARILDCKSHGYAEWITHHPADSPADFGRFYHNAGRLAAFFYVMGASDCHQQNLIAHGDQIVPIDLETLFEPTPSPDVRKALSSKRSASQDSILYCGMLPQPRQAQGAASMVDTSAMGAPGVFPPLQTCVGWANANTDWMCRRHGTWPIAPPESSPVRAGQPNPFFDHGEDFCHGLSTQCDVLITQRDGWLRTGGILDRMAGITRRMVLRPTRVYAAILEAQRHAGALRSALAQRLIAEQLACLYLTSEHRPRDWPMLDDEIQQLTSGDIPYFQHRADHSALMLSDGEAIENYFVTNGVDECRHRLATLDHHGIQRQISIIRAAIDQARPDRQHDPRCQNAPV